MAIEEIKRWLCDLCLARGVQRDAKHRNVPVTIEDAPTRTLDLCGRHRRELLHPVEVALAKYGGTPGEDKPMPKGRRDSNRHRQGVGPYRCLVRGCVSTPLKHRGTLWQHVRGVHHITLDEYIEQYGQPVPMTPEEQAALVVEASCPVDDCDTVYSTADGYRWPQMALVSHLWGHHGIKERA